MQKNTDRRSVILLAASAVFLLDQFFKYLARAAPDFSFYIWEPWLGWEYFANNGIAFSLPFPHFLILLATPAFLLALLIFSKKRPMALLIIAGALGNFVDRVFFGHTIDYIRIATGVFNLADFMILIGLLVLLFRR